MDDGEHDLTRSFGVTMRDRDGDFFVTAENHLRVGLSAALVIHKRIVNAAEARPGVECDVLDAQDFEQINDEIRTITCGHKHLPGRLFTAKSDRGPSPFANRQCASAVQRSKFKVEMGSGG